MLLTPIIFLLILSVLVLIHEAGHYFVAKKLGIKVEEFGFGLPPRAWGKKVGETIYSLNWLPIGGFVKLYGEDEAGSGRVSVSKEHKGHKEDEHRAFNSRPVGQRAAVVVAGVVMNTLLAIAIYYVFMFISGFKTDLPLLGNHQFFFVDQQKKSAIIVSSVAPNSPAAKAGITPFSQLLSINGQKMEATDEFIATVKADKGKQVLLEWQDETTNKISKASVLLRQNPPKDEGSLGVVFYPEDTVTLSYDTPAQKALSGIIHPANLMVYNFAVLKTLVGISIKEKNVDMISKGVAGPVGIYKLVDSDVSIPDEKVRLLKILDLAGLLSISLAFFNVLPIPGLDGGRLFFIIIEGIIGRKVNQKFEGYAHAVGMALLIGLIILITFKDISQFLIK